jgi:TatD DNase family protein
MELIDTHAHLFLPDFEEDYSQVMERALQTGVRKILLPNIDASTIDAMLKLCSLYPDFCYPMIGLHPTSVKEDYAKHLNEIKKILDLHQFIAIGEVGIDLYWDKTFLSQQREAFIDQIDLARKYSLPLVIHSRESYHEILEILHCCDNGSPYSGVFHSFSGNTEQANEVIEMGFKLGISGVVTFKNSGIAEVIRNISLENIVLETDAPYLTPVPNRGKRNESCYLVYIAEKIAEIKDLTAMEVGRVTSKNANTIFKLS